MTSINAALDAVVLNSMGAIGLAGQLIGAAHFRAGSPRMGRLASRAHS